MSKQTRNGRVGSKVVQIDPKWDKSGAFSDQKAPDLSHFGPIWTTLIPETDPLPVTYRGEEVSDPLGDHEGDHDADAEGDVPCTLHDDDSQRDGGAEDAA